MNREKSNQTGILGNENVMLEMIISASYGNAVSIIGTHENDLQLQAIVYMQKEKTHRLRNR